MYNVHTCNYIYHVYTCTCIITYIRTVIVHVLFSHVRAIMTVVPPAAISLACTLYSVPRTYMYMYMHVGRALYLEYRVSWVRVPPEAAHFF